MSCRLCCPMAWKDYLSNAVVILGADVLGNKENDEDNNAENRKNDEIQLHVLPPPAPQLLYNTRATRVREACGKLHFALQVCGVLVKEHALLRQALCTVDLAEETGDLSGESVLIIIRVGVMG